MTARTIGLALLMLLPLATAGRLAEGERAPGFKLRDTQGKEVSYQPPKAGSARKEVTLLVFLEPGQDASRTVLRELRELLRVKRELAPRVRTLAIVSGETNAERLAALQDSLPPGSPIAVALDPDRRVRQAYGVIALPTTFVVHPDGRIKHVLPGRSAAYRQRVLTAIRDSLGLQVEEAAPKSDEEKRAGRHRRLAETLLGQQRFEQAAQQLEEAWQLNPEDSQIAVLLGEVRLELGQGEAAAKSFRAALALDPKLRAARAGVAKALSLTGGGEEAEKGLRKEMARPHADPDLFYYFGRLLERRGAFEEAAQTYRRAYEQLKRRKR